MAKLPFVFITSENLARKFFIVPQATVEIDVKGAENPLTHQRMRDAVEPLFKKTHSQINDYIKQADLQIMRMGVNERKRDKARLIATGNEKISGLLSKFRGEAQSTLNEFMKREAEIAAKVQAAEDSENWRAINFAISVTWTGLKAIGGLLTAEVATGGAAIPLVIKEFVDNLMDLKKLYDDLGDHYATIQAAKKRVKDGLANLKSKPKIINSEVEALANDVKLYEGKLLAMEVKAKSITAKITSALNAVPKNGITAEARKKAEDTLHLNLTELVDTSNSIRSNQAYIANLKKSMAAARALAKSDPALVAVKNWAGTIYSKINDFKDIALDPKQLVTWIDAAVKFFGDTRNVLEP